MVLDLGFGQRGLFHRRPHHGFGALVERAVHEEFHELLSDHAFGVEVHRQVRLRPISSDTQPLEFIALDADPPLGKAAAFGAEFVDWHLVLVLTLFAVLFFDLPFDGQTVAIPTGDIARIAAHHLVTANDHVFDRFVQRVADMQMPVGIGRAVVQREGLAPLFLAQAVVNADLFPTGEPIRLAVGQACAHRKIGLGQVQRVFVVNGFGRIGAHGRHPWKTENQGVRAVRSG